MATVDQKRKELSTIYSDLERFQTKMEDGNIDQNEGEKATELAKRAETLQNELEQYEQTKRLAAKGREIREDRLPGDGQERKTQDITAKATPGEMFVSDRKFRQWAQGSASGWSPRVEIPNLDGRPVKLSGKRAQEFMESKAEAIPGLGEDAIIPEFRDPEVVRFEEPEILNLRQLFGSLPANSDTVSFVRHTLTGRGASSQEGRGAAKGYLNIEFDKATVPVETVAVLSKIAEQDMQDAPRLAGIVNGEMTLDIDVEVERQLLWGTGLTNEIEGLFEVGVPEFDRSAVGDTTLDTIRKMRTDLRMSRVRPSALAISPLDWEEVELTKADDDHYIWAVVQTTRGPQVWSLQVVEVDSLENPATEERRILMGDFQRGATVYDRNSTTLAVGYVDDDFERNLRTLRAEQRLAFAVKRDFAFSYVQTQAPSGT